MSFKPMHKRSGTLIASSRGDPFNCAICEPEGLNPQVLPFLFAWAWPGSFPYLHDPRAARANSP
jgi:hypothetical protein